MMNIITCVPGHGDMPSVSPSRTGRGFQFSSIHSGSSSNHPITSGHDGADHSRYTADCLHIGPRGYGGSE